jgi:hypothetical protein
MTAPVHRSAWALAVAVIAALTLWRFSSAAVLPVTQDEAYYFDWARHLAWGYFDHPPGVALLGLTTRWEPGSAFMARLGGLSVGLITLLVLANFYRHCGVTQHRELALALLLVGTTLPGLIGGVITTPDTALALGWALALHESERALNGERRRWLTAGAAIGLGLLGKYTMVLIGPVVLWAMWRSDRQALRSPWPYLGAVVALIVFAPHLIWNAEHDWLTMRFQLGHGLSTDVGVVAAVPAAMSLGERFASVAEYLVTQLAFWGALLVVIGRKVVSGQWSVVRVDATTRRGMLGEMTPPAQPLLLAATLFPLAFFGVIASFSAVEANWPALYLLTAAPLLVRWVHDRWRWVLGAALGNVLLVSLYVGHAATSVVPLPDAFNRILRETHGFAELAQVVAALDAPVYADRYQTTALLRFYTQNHTISQWPELTRPSEYLRGDIAPRVELSTVTAPLWLVARAGRPPALAGLICTAERTVVDCPPQWDGTAVTCPQPLHVWHLYRYERPALPVL